MRLDATSNGLGGQSMLLWWMACEKHIPATVGITADTGSEEDRLLCDGSRISAREFFEKHVKPMGRRAGLKAFFVRAQYKDGREMPPLHDPRSLRQNVPLFGSEGGRLRQTCTDKWKLRAIRQQLRRLGATKARNAVGLHFDEAVRRMTGILLGKIKHAGVCYRLFQSVDGRKPPKPIRWMAHYYPLIELRMGRQAVRDKLQRLGVPYLLTTECDHCPHKDDSRWLASSSETIERVAELEALYGGEFFFTDRRIPLKLAIEDMRRHPKPSEPTFGCKTQFCGI